MEQMFLDQAVEEERFKRAVIESRSGVLVVQRHLIARGYQTELPPQRVRASFEERHGQGDDADLFFFTITGQKVGIEVKSRSLRFTSAADFPFKTVMLDRVEKTDKSSVSYYVLLNLEKTVMAVVRAATKAQWSKMYCFDTTKGYASWQYACNLELVKFIKVIGGA